MSAVPSAAERPLLNITAEELPQYFNLFFSYFVYRLQYTEQVFYLCYPEGINRIICKAVVQRQDFLLKDCHAHIAPPLKVNRLFYPPVFCIRKPILFSLP